MNQTTAVTDDLGCHAMQCRSSLMAVAQIP